MSDAAPARIVLIGLSGTGKSSVARLLARTLRWEWGDSDDLVVSHDGRSIPQIFKDEGEEHFRRLERVAVGQLTRGERIVIATGGGAVLSPENRRRLWSDALVVRLSARAEALVSRVSVGVRAGEARPLLAGADPLPRLRALQVEREPLYALADWTVQTDTLTPAEVADEVARVYRTHAAALVARPGRVEEVEQQREPAERVDPDMAATVRTPAAQYPIVVGWGILGSLADRLRAAGLTGRISVISDAHVAHLHGEALLGTLRAAGFDAEICRVQPGEEHKTLGAAASVFDWLVQRRHERGEAIIAFGGGMVTDLAGFAAATYLRGVPLVHLPTSLLGAMDAAIGGKVAVDLHDGKNLIGAFYQPRFVLVDAELLRSLPPRELTSGWAEVIKHGLIMDLGLIKYLEENVASVRALEPDALMPVLRRSAQLKAQVVSADERESGPRLSLNYGHTIGHAIEAATGYRAVLHGEAVAVGMAAAGEISRRLGLLDEAELQRQNALLAAYGLPRTWLGIEPERVLAATTLDKKVKGAALRWVLLHGLGRSVIRADVPLAVVRDVVEGVLAGGQPNGNT
jgi:shikimate kinase/3-dehydroquinate synthase